MERKFVLQKEYDNSNYQSVNISPAVNAVTVPSCKIGADRAMHAECLRYCQRLYLAFCLYLKGDRGDLQETQREKVVNNKATETPGRSDLNQAVSYPR